MLFEAQNIGKNSAVDLRTNGELLVSSELPKDDIRRFREELPGPETWAFLESGKEQRQVMPWVEKGRGELKVSQIDFDELKSGRKKILTAVVFHYSDSRGRQYVSDFCFALPGPAAASGWKNFFPAESHD
jgi:hypothetical protein